MRVLILGAAGYIGAALTAYLRRHRELYEVFGCDNFWRAEKAVSMVPTEPPSAVDYLDVTGYDELEGYIRWCSPDAVVHLAEQPSAPYSMKGPEEASFTLSNNTVSTMNVLWAIHKVDKDIRLLKLGTAGEYVDWLYPSYIRIPEQPRIMVEYMGEDWLIPTPRFFGSTYHASKLFDSYLCDYYARVWGLHIIDINQAPVYGWVPGTRFDYDECFGTVVNRFIAQALSGSPITIYGTGQQVRGFIYLPDALEAIRLLLLNQFRWGDYRCKVVHQLTETRTIESIASMVARLTGGEVIRLPNPRAEMQQNSFNFEARKLGELGLKPTYMEEALPGIVEQLCPYAGNVDPSLFNPTIEWGGESEGLA